MRILVCGGRGFDDRDFLYKTLYDFCDKYGLWHDADEYGNTLPRCTIISGEARGADQLAKDFAVVNWTGYEGYPADWEQHGRKAGILRNIQMLEEGFPDVVLAFPGGRGTAHMKRIAKEAGVEVLEFEQPVS